MDETIDEKTASIHDLVEYKIAKELDGYSIGTPDWQALFNVLELYLEGTIAVKWSGIDMLVSMSDGSEIDPELLFCGINSEEFKAGDSDIEIEPYEDPNDSDPDD